MIRIFGAAIFFSAALLFLIQPMAAKLVLPILGGTPSVWNTAMAFFQTMLILGYLYSHLLTRKLPLTAQFGVHAAVLACVVLTLPIGLPRVLYSGLTPTGWLLATLVVIAGLPYFAVATTGPLLQSWFGATTDPRAKDPYFLYAASNAGSFVGLLCFPFVIEPNFALDGQAEVWTVGYCILVAMVLLSGLLTLRNRRPTEKTAAEEARADPVTIGKGLLWIALAAAPSSMSLGATAAITMDVAAIPLLWILPLSIYLLTYTLAFSSRFKLSSGKAGWFAIVAVLAVAINDIASLKFPLLWIVGAHMAALAGCAYACHRRLYETRPGVSRLTEFYLLAAVGGAIGGVFNAIVAPSVFRSFAEYPISMALCVILIAPSAASLRIRWWKHVVMTTLGAGIIFGAGMLMLGPFEEWASVPVFAGVMGTLCLMLALLPVRGGGNYRVAAAVLTAIFFTHAVREWQRGVVFGGRSFFGVYAVYKSDSRLRISHGSTLHGEQFLAPELQDVPISYYHRLGPLGDIFAAARAEDRQLRIAAVGLGAGTIAAYTVKGDELTFFEIDPLVRSIAEHPQLFTFIGRARERGVKVETIIGDGRIGLNVTDKQFDLIILDAFSSDSVPIHLLTLEAFETYRERLSPNGILAVHTSNRYFELSAMVVNVAARVDLACAFRLDRMAQTDASAVRKQSTWLALAHNKDVLRPLLQRPEWFATKPDPKQRVWTDSYSSIFDVPWR
ncbi:MAG: fused MFS/spermidine synthase [Phycisphaerae bacterium]|nr:fused MFS/spermidine synthase [Phycisphaerae bacterium]